VRVFYCDHLEVPLPPRHRFPMSKYRAVRDRLVASGVVAADELQPAPSASAADLRLVHTPEYVEAFLTGTLERRAISRLGFPWSPELVARCLASVGGTLAASFAALDEGLAGTLAGGTHHAYADFGAGYCAFNDIAISIQRLRAEARIERALIVDLDVHQGDGSAALFAGDDAVFTFSMHAARNFPARKARSDRDVELADDIGDAEYLATLACELPQVLERAGPQALFYQAGVDPLATDRLGRLALTPAGLAERDRLVLESARERELPIVLTLGGGYAEPITDTVAAHVATYRVARSVFAGAPSN